MRLCWKAIAEAMTTTHGAAIAGHGGRPGTWFGEAPGSHHLQPAEMRAFFCVVDNRSYLLRAVTPYAPGLGILAGLALASEGGGQNRDLGSILVHSGIFFYSSAINNKYQKSFIYH